MITVKDSVLENKAIKVAQNIFPALKNKNNSYKISMHRVTKAGSDLTNTICALIDCGKTTIRVDDIEGKCVAQFW